MNRIIVANKKINDYVIATLSRSNCYRNHNPIGQFYLSFPSTNKALDARDAAPVSKYLKMDVCLKININTCNFKNCNTSICHLSK